LKLLANIVLSIGRGYPNNFTELNSVYSDIKFEDLYYRKISL